VIDAFGIEAHGAPLGKLAGRLLPDAVAAKAMEKGGVDREGLAAHKVPPEKAPNMYELFQKEQDGAIKVVLKP